MSNFEAIQSMYPEAAFSMVNDDISTIAWRTEGIITPNQEEINNEIKRLADEAEATAAAKANAKSNARTKLAALGLLDEEIAAITNN